MTLEDMVKADLWALGSWVHYLYFRAHRYEEMFENMEEKINSFELQPTSKRVQRQRLVNLVSYLS